MELTYRVRVPDRVSRGHRPMFSSSDDNSMQNQILATHAPDGREFEVRPVLRVLESVFRRAKPTAPGAVPEGRGQPHSETPDDAAIREALEFLADTINRVACECMIGGDAQSTAMNILDILSTYNWDAKAVLALAALAVGYAAEILQWDADAAGPMLDALARLVTAMVELTKCIIELTELPPQYISTDEPEISAAVRHIPMATYWIIRSAVACTSNIVIRPECTASTAETWELSSLAYKLGSIRDHLTKQLVLCHQLINEKKHIKAFQILVQLFDVPHTDNIKILQALIYAKDDQPPLVDGSTKRRAGLDVLRRKIVLLLISKIDIPAEELAVLELMYAESRQQPARPESQYEIVWIPVVDQSVPWTDETRKQFEHTRGTMPWHSVYDPSFIDPVVIEYIKEVWKFNKKTKLVVLDPQGKVVNCNALHMLWIWGSLAYPFTSAREEALWKEQTWNIKLFVDTIGFPILNWVSEGRYICLYGGEDLEWIRKFTATIRAFSGATKIPIEMLYVGKSNPKENIRKINAAIESEKLSHTLPHLTVMWLFWVRLESMWHSKMQTAKSVETDPIMREIMTMVSYDSSDPGWAVISRGSAEMARAKGDAMLSTLREYDFWKDKIEQKGFVPALNDRLKDLHTRHHCTPLVLPGTAGQIPERMACGECGCTMEKFIMYRCCRE